MDSMLAALPVHATGTVETTRIARPRPAAGEVVVEVMAAGMNRADLLHARGRYAQRMRLPGRPDVAGMEMSGRVVEVGDGVSDQALGSRVMAMFPGTYAEYVAVPADLLLPVPDRLSWTEAAALPMGLLTEYEAIVRLAQATTTDRVMITAATSGVGLIGLQVARQRGLEPVATTRDPANADLLRSAGAVEVAHDSDSLKELLADGADVVIDHVGGEIFEVVQGMLRDNARVVSVGRLGRRSARVDLAAFAGRRARLIGTTWRSQTHADVAKTVAGVRADMTEAIAAGQIRPLISTVEVFGDIAGAFERLDGPRSPGKVVVTCRPEAA